MTKKEQIELLELAGDNLIRAIRDLKKGKTKEADYWLDHAVIFAKDVQKKRKNVREESQATRLARLVPMY